MNKQSMTAKEYRDKFVTPAKLTRFSEQHQSQKQSMTAAEWREMMRKKKNKGSTKNVDEIRIMLQLAKIEFVEEHRFHKTRKWRFDFALLQQKIAIEYEGIHSKKSRHTTRTGYQKDTEKYNAAASDGWKVLRYTANNYKQIIEDLNNITCKE